jgi:hypothetical protein
MKFQLACSVDVERLSLTALTLVLIGVLDDSNLEGRCEPDSNIRPLWTLTPTRK